MVGGSLSIGEANQCLTGSLNPGRATQLIAFASLNARPAESFLSLRALTPVSPISGSIQKGLMKFGEASAALRIHQRNSRGPSHAPIAVGINIPSRYHVAMNGVASSGQCRV